MKEPYISISLQMHYKNYPKDGRGKLLGASYSINKDGGLMLDELIPSFAFALCEFIWDSPYCNDRKVFAAMLGNASKRLSALSEAQLRLIELEEG